jgi:hypothetical protein
MKNNSCDVTTNNDIVTKQNFVRCCNKCKDHTNEKLIIPRQNEIARKWVKKKKKHCNRIDLQVQCKRLLVIIDVNVGCNNEKIKKYNINHNIVKKDFVCGNERMQ